MMPMAAPAAEIEIGAEVVQRQRPQHSGGYRTAPPRRSSRGGQLRRTGEVGHRADAHTKASGATTGANRRRTAPAPRH